MITCSHDVDTFEEAFGFALKVDLTFKGLFITKAWDQCFKCEGYEHYDYQCPLVSQHVRIVPSDNVDNSKVDVSILPEITCIVEDILIDSCTPIVDEVYISSDSTRMTWMR